MKDLLLEIGVEELPARFVADGAAALAAGIVTGLDAVGLHHGPCRVFASPRRLAVLVAVADHTEEQRRTLLGPPLSVAFGSDGTPTKAASALATRAGCAVEALGRVQTDKGVYVTAELVEPRKPATEFLSTIAHRAIAIDFPKSMRWGDVVTTFARPVQWLCCMFGDVVVDVVLGDVRSGRASRGHRFHHPEPFELAMAGDYDGELRRRRVIADPAERRALLDERLAACEAQLGGTLVAAPELRDEVLYLVEDPRPVFGSFPEAYLSLPDEVLMQEMQRHQRYFAIAGPSGELLPRFVAVSNTEVGDPGVSARGYERVLRARLADARFFFDEDRRRTLASRIPALDDIVFHHALGSVAAKAKRLVELVSHLAEITGHRALVPTLVRAAVLAKSDLSTLMVGEFPDLQGVMGREYALHDGEPEAVAVAVAEHYLPRGADDRIPEHDAGALLGIADRLDSVCALLAVGEGPTSTKDPFALRRACVGAIRLAVEKGLSFSLRDIIVRIEGLLAERLDAAASALRGPALREAVTTFVRGRMKAAWSQRLPADVVEAALQADADDIALAYRRAAALADFSRREGFDVVAATFKRVVNILRKEGASRGDTCVDPTLLRESAELSLHAAVSATAQVVGVALSERRFDEAFTALGELERPVAAFFEGVLVLAEDRAIRSNRIALLGSVAEILAPLADVSALASVRTADHDAPPPGEVTGRATA